MYIPQRHDLWALYEFVPGGLKHRITQSGNKLKTWARELPIIFEANLTEELICTQDARTGLMKDAVLFWRKYKPNGSKYILVTGRSLRIKSKDPVFVCINPTITNIPDLPTGLTDKNAKQWLYSFRVSVKDPVEKALREIGYNRSFRTYFESMRSIMDYDKLLTPSEYLEIHSLVVSISRLIDDYQYIKATGHDLSLA